MSISNNSPKSIKRSPILHPISIISAIAAAIALIIWITGIIDGGKSSIEIGAMHWTPTWETHTQHAQEAHHDWEHASHSHWNWNAHWAGSAHSHV